MSQENDEEFVRKFVFLAWHIGGLKPNTNPNWKYTVVDVSKFKVDGERAVAFMPKTSSEVRDFFKFIVWFKNQYHKIPPIILWANEYRE